MPSIIARKTRQIIDHIQPQFHVVENPNSSLICKQGIFDDYKTVKVSYCKYGYKYRKNTRLATNVDFEPKICNWDCGRMRGFRHIAGGLGAQSNTHKRDELWTIPEQLVRDLIQAATKQNAGA